MRYQTINQAGKRDDLPNAGVLRRLVKSGTCPGFHSGTRFYIDTVQLAEQLSNQSARSRGEA